MRHELATILGEEMRFLAIETRNQLELTQKAMGEMLYMSESSYSDLETGETTCASTLTGVILLTLQEDPAVFLKRVERRFEECYGKERQPV